jgi:phosphoglycerate kinase
MEKMSLKDINTENKRVLVRVDFNVPLHRETREITDDSRIVAALPTIKYLVERNAKIILVSHLGRPKGKVVDELRLTVVAQRLSQILGQQVGVATDCIGPEVEKSMEALKNGDVMLLENLRFHSDEETGSSDFARELARLGDVFVNDAFGTSHRAHASIAGIAQFLPAVAGLLLETEIRILGGILENPAHPFASVLGGAKVSDKVGMVENIMGRVDSLLIGGGMAATFLKAKSYGVGRSLVEEDNISSAEALMEKALKNGIQLLLPVDVVVANEMPDKAEVAIVSVEDIPDNKRIVDIGPRTTNNFCAELKKCRTVFWNGPVGIFEIAQYAKGTRMMAELIANIKAKTIIGGGSTAEVIYELGLADKMTFVSTGGGASLKFLSGESLPGIEALRDKK